MGTDDEWEKWGRSEPYFGVLTNEKFKVAAIDDQARADFFASGQRDVDRALARCRKLMGDGFTPATALDFGCGVGRTTVPLARICERVVGVDVSPSMLQEAQKNLDAEGIDNVDLRLSDDRLSRVPEQFDLVNTQIVLQHIPTDRGIHIFEELVKRVSPGGVGSIQLTYARAKHAKGLGVPRYPWLVNLDKTASQVLDKLSNLMGNSRPRMQMNQYDLNQVFYVMQVNGAKDVQVEYTDHDEHLGVFLTFNKHAEAS